MSPDMLGGGGAPMGAPPGGMPPGGAPPGLPPTDPTLLLKQLIRKGTRKSPKGKKRRGKKVK